MQLIGINGMKTAGKDTTYAMLKEIAAPLRVQRVGFADKLKHVAAKALGYEGSVESAVKLMDSCKEQWTFEVSEPDCTGLNDVFQMFSGRQYLQWIGGGARDVFGENFWVDQTLPSPKAYDYGRELEVRYPDADILVVTDVRYPNEAQRVHELEGEVWQVVRPGLEADGHVSEVPLPLFMVDAVLQNDHDLAKLRATVELAYEARIALV